MRGKAGFAYNIDAINRITPAYAGKRQAVYHRCRTAEDHPRLCGEKKMPSPSCATEVGSPPPMRGKADVVLNRIDRIGITPAYAGKSCHEGGKSPIW